MILRTNHLILVRQVKGLRFQSLSFDSTTDIASRQIERSRLLDYAELLITSTP